MCGRVHGDVCRGMLCVGRLAAQDPKSANMSEHIRRHSVGDADRDADLELTVEVLDASLEADERLSQTDRQLEPQVVALP